MHQTKRPTAYHFHTTLTHHLDGFVLLLLVIEKRADKEAGKYASYDPSNGAKARNLATVGPVCVRAF